jgi:hypothetical protein
MRILTIISIAALGLALANAPASPQGARPCGSLEPINTLRQAWEALYACWEPPASSEGMEITLLFSLRRDGTLIGRPRATWSITALDRALPLPLTDGMGGAVAGRPLTLRFSVTGGGPIRSL